MEDIEETKRHLIELERELERANEEKQREIDSLTREIFQRNNVRHTLSVKGKCKIISLHD